MTTLVVTGKIASDLADAARQDVESAAVLLAGAAQLPDRGLRLLGRELHWIDDHHYLQRTRNELSIPPAGYLEALRRAEDLGIVPIFVHTHPGGVPRPSRRDDRVDEQLRELFRIRSGSDVYASVVVAPRDKGLTFTGRGIKGERPFNIDRLLVSGERIALLSSFEVSEEREMPTRFDRQVRAFGGEIQAVLGSLNVGVVGCGGTGSAVAEQLVRLGVRSLTLVDPDTLSATNVTRVYGSTPADRGRAKPEVLGEHLRRIAPDISIESIGGSVTDQSVARRLVECDVLFGCTDDNAGRLVLARLSSYFLVPLFDCGVLISSSDGVIRGIDGRVTVQTPGSACLVCRDRIDLARAGAEQLEEGERRGLEREGYAPELGRIEPAVVTFTSAVASQAVTEMLERLIAFGPDPVPSEILLRLHEREISSNTAEPRAGHFCDPSAPTLGMGDTDPFLGQLWRAS